MDLEALASQPARRAQDWSSRTAFSPRFLLLKTLVSPRPAGCGTSTGSNPSIKESSSVRHNLHPTQGGQSSINTGHRREPVVALGMMDGYHPAL